MSHTGFKTSCLTKWKPSAVRHPCEFFFLDNGKFNIRHEDVPYMLSHYVHAILSNETISLVEVKTEPFFVWFIDLDFKSSETIPDDFIISVGKTIQASISECRTRCAVAISRKPSKTGVHMVFPDVVLCRTRANELRQRCLTLMQKNDKFKLIDSTTFDDSVYRARTGLRVLYSTKGKNDLHTYVPNYLLDLEGECGVLDSNVTLENMKLFSIQYHGGGNELPIISRHISRLLTNSRRGSERPFSFDDALCSTEEWPKLTELLMRFYSKEKNPQTLLTRRVMNGEDWVVFGSKSNACLNVKYGVHSNATIYFVCEITKQNIVIRQKCFSGCDTSRNRISGTCQRFNMKLVEFNRNSINNADLVREILGK